MANYRTDAPEAIKEFLLHQKNSKGLLDSTLNEYFLDLRMFFRFVKRDRAAVPPDILFDEIDIKDVDYAFIKGIRKYDIFNFINYIRSDRAINEGSKKKETEYGLMASSAQRKIACIKSFFKYYSDTNSILDKDPTLGISTPKTRKTVPSLLTLNESVRLLDAVKGLNEKRDYCIILIFLTTALRVSEIVKINIQDIQHAIVGDEPFLKIHGKGDKERQVYLSDACVEAIKDYLSVREEYEPDKKHENALFLSRKHCRISVDAVQGLVKKAMKKAGLPEGVRSPHKLRHTAATLMLQNGVDVRALQEVLGHESLSTTQIYTHVSSDVLRVATQTNPISKVKKKK